MADVPNRNPGPWRFHIRRFFFAHVVADADGRYMVSGVPIGSGPLLAAGPDLLAALERVASLTAPGTPTHDVATGAIENLREREGMVLADWKPGPLPPARPRLRIVSIAT